MTHFAHPARCTKSSSTIELVRAVEAVCGLCSRGIYDKKDVVTNRPSSLALDLGLRVLALCLEEAIDIVDHGESSDIVTGELKASERGLQWMCKDSESTFCQKG
jgi:hypothetical protein